MTKRDVCALWPLLVPVASGLMWVAGLLGAPPRLTFLVVLACCVVGSVAASWAMWRSL